MYGNNVIYAYNIVTENGNARYRALPSIAEHCRALLRHGNNVIYAYNIVTENSNARYRALTSIAEHCRALTSINEH
jgi:hypothetical protein